MLTRFARAAALLLSGMLLSLPMLPPEHGHPSNPDRSGVVHRHASLHVLRHSAHPTLNEDDGLIIWIDGAYSAGAGPHWAVDAADVASPAWIVRPLVSSYLRRQVVGRHAHDPPLRPSSPRAPPFFQFV